MVVLNQAATILQLGFIYGIVAIGVYITYKILDFPDLSVDGTFPLGGVLFAVLITAGCPWPVAMLVSFCAGGAAGFVTGVLHVKLKINGLLSGIITMTALLSVNILISGGAQIPFAKEETMLSNDFLSSVPRLGRLYVRVGFVFAVIIVCKILLDLFLKTKSGFLLRATGDNAQLVTQMGKNTDNYKMLGLSLANAFVALAGSIFVQYSAAYTTGMGTGTVVIALACVIVGCVISKHIRFMKDTTGVIIGALIYYTVFSLALFALGTNYTNLIAAVLFVIVLLFDSGLIGRTVRRIFPCGKKKAAEEKRDA